MLSCTGASGSACTKVTITATGLQWGFVWLCLLSLLVLPTNAQTQAQNLLQNPGFEGAYEARQVGVTLAAGWQSWWATTPREADWMNVKPVYASYSGEDVYSGATSQMLMADDSTFTAALYQSVRITPNALLRAEAAIKLQNSTDSRTRARVGIGSGFDPQASDIIWSEWATTPDSWQTLSIETRWNNEIATLFIQMAQAAPNSTNRVYVDEAALVLLEGAAQPQAAAPQASATSTQPAPQATTDTSTQPETQVSAPIDTQAPPSATQTPAISDTPAPTARPRITHRVQEGDTLISIALTYGVDVDDIRALNDLSGDIIQINQELIISAGDPPTPTPAPTIPPTDTPDPTAAALARITPIDPFTAPTAPVTAGAQVNPLAQDTLVCMEVYADVNQNRIRDTGNADQTLNEGRVSGGTVQLQDAQGDVVLSYTSNANAQQTYCSAEVPPGRYVVLAQAPQGYTLTTPRRLQLDVQSGVRLQVRVGVLQTDATPTPTVDATPLPPMLGPADDAQPPELADVAGLIVLGLAGIVLFVGTIMALIARRL